MQFKLEKKKKKKEHMESSEWLSYHAPLDPLIKSGIQIEQYYHKEKQNYSSVHKSFFFM